MGATSTNYAIYSLTHFSKQKSQNQNTDMALGEYGLIKIASL